MGLQIYGTMKRWSRITEDGYSEMIRFGRGDPPQADDPLDLQIYGTMKRWSRITEDGYSEMIRFGRGEKI